MKLCCESLLGSEHLLLMLVGTRDFVTGKVPAQRAARMKVRSIVTGNFFFGFFFHPLLDPQFVPNLKKAVAILEPVDHLIKKYQTDSIPLSVVVKDFLELPSILGKTLTQAELQFICAEIKERMEFLMSPAHFAVIFI
jgi:hypothetical protein